MVRLIFAGLIVFVFVTSSMQAAEYSISAIAGPTVEAFHNAPRMNDVGEVVWYERHGSFDWDIYSNVRGQLTSEDYRHALPDINDQGSTVWQSDFANDGTTWDIVRDGTRLTNNGRIDTAPRINNMGEIVWESEQGIFSSVRGVVAGEPVSSPEINDFGEVVFRRSTSEIVSTLQGFLGSGDHPSINNLGHVVWMTAFQSGIGHQIISSVHGVIGVGQYPDVNDQGEIVFNRDISPNKSVVVVWSEGTESILDLGPFNPIPFPVINNSGLIAIAASSLTGQSAVFLAAPIPEPDTLVLFMLTLMATSVVRGRSN